MFVGSWTFDTAKTAANFERHVRSQLPWYDQATDAVALISWHFIPDGGVVYDIGCGTGNVGRSLDEVLIQRKATFFPIDRSREMCRNYCGPGMPQAVDITKVELQPFDLAVCMLVLMFLSPAEQAELLQRLMAKVKPGGAVIVLEKMIGPGGYAQTIMQRLTFAGKAAMGTDGDSIIKKEFSLIGVQRPIDETIIHNTCPKAVRFFQYGEFSGYLLQK